MTKRPKIGSRKGGHNVEPSKVTKRPAAPAPMKPPTFRPTLPESQQHMDSLRAIMKQWPRMATDSAPPIPSPRDIAVQAAGALLDEAGQDLCDDLDFALRDFTVRTRRVVSAIRVTPLPDGTYKIGLTVRRITT